MEKVIRDGKVAVLYSPGYGAGWYSWHHVIELVFDPEVVKMVEEGNFTAIEEYCEKTYGDKYYGGASDLEIAWLPVGTQFEIDEYDGNESVRDMGKVQFLIA